MNPEKTRTTEEKMAGLFSEKKPFSEHFIKWEDNSLPDKYDHNCFEYTGQPTTGEFRKALEYQRRRGNTFIKMEGDRPLTDSFGLEEDITVTMVLNRDVRGWRRNKNLRFDSPSIEELEEIELKHFGPVYGESFTLRNVRRLHEKLRYHGAYKGNVLAASCYTFSSQGMVCIDGLIVDEAYRNQYIATSLIAHIAETYAGSTVFLHADEADTPMEMYLKMGFEITDHLYEYSCTDVSLLSGLYGRYTDVGFRKLRAEETDLLKEFLYEAIFIPEGMEPPDRSIVDLPELALYYEDFGKGQADVCFLAEAEGKAVGAVWTRLMDDYGHVDDETPSFAISLYKEYRSRGIGTVMMRLMLDHLRRQGYRSASLAVQKANPAVKMYRRVGFRTIRENDEEYIMVCRL